MNADTDMNARLDESDVTQAARACIAVLEGNRRRGRSQTAGHDFDFTCPSPDSYPFQWAWDSSFQAIALTHLDSARARAEIDTLLKTVTDTGFLPHMALWQDSLREQAVIQFRIDIWELWRSVTIAPPVVAAALARIHAATGDDAWLRRCLGPVTAYFDWLHEHRVSSETGLLLTYQPDESGLDMSPKYDGALGLTGLPADLVLRGWHRSMFDLLDVYRPGRAPESRLEAHGQFAWHDVLVNSIYADSLMKLSRLAEAAGAGRREAERLARRSREIAAALIEHCWDETVGVFWDVDARSGRQVKVLTASCLFPLIVEHIPTRYAKRLTEEHLLNENEFWRPYPIPSVAASEPAYDPDFATRAIFRGSSWINLNWYLYQGLRDRGYQDPARNLATRTIAMIARSGLRECYGPESAEGHGAHDFGWSSLALDLMHSEGLLPPLEHLLAPAVAQ